jgi:hypothetical protein
MIFQRHPKLISDADLCTWLNSLIKRKAPESDYLDYKESISISTQKEKMELCKDVTSFANENGGALIYGVPETDQNGVPVPKDIAECGIELPSDLIINIENILLDVIAPPLPELFIKVISLDGTSSKSVLLIYHPGSWNKPHMVEGYKQGRYYRRGNFRSILMYEKQIEEAYLKRKASSESARAFFEGTNFRKIPTQGTFLRAVACPHYSLYRREEMAERTFKNWLDSNPPGGRRGEWVPFIDGWCFRGYPQGNFYGKQYEIRFFHNGAICLDIDLSTEIENELLKLTWIEEYVFSELFLPYSAKVLEAHKINGPISFKFQLFNAKGLSAKIKPGSWYSDPKIGATPIETDSLSFVEDSSVNELNLFQPNLLKRLVDRFSSAFGLWRN